MAHLLARDNNDYRVGQVVKWVQTSAILEVVHAATGLVYVPLSHALRTRGVDP